MRAALIFSGLLSALTTFGIAASHVGAMDNRAGIAAAVLTGQSLTGFGVTAFCFFGASVLGHLKRQNDAQTRAIELLAAIRDRLPDWPQLLEQEGELVADAPKAAGRAERIEGVPGSRTGG